MQTRAFIQAFRSRLRAVVAIDFSCWFVVLGGSTLFYIGMLDFLTTYGYLPLVPPFPWALRLLFLLAWVVLMAHLSWRHLLRPMLQDFSDANLARIAERRLPGIDGRLFTELDGIALGERDRRELDGILDGRALARLVPASRLRFLVRSASLVFLGLLAWSWYYPGYARKAVRNFFTLANEFPQNTLLVAALADRVVPVDRSLVVRVHREREEAPITLSWRDAAGRCDQRRLPSHRRRWNEAFDLGEPGTYLLRASAGPRANVVDLKGWVVPRPAVAALDVTLTPPAYVNAYQPDAVAVQRIDTLAAKAILPGTDCRFTIDLADEELPDDGELAAEGHIAVAVNGQQVPFERTGRRLRGRFEIRGPCDVAIELATVYRVADGGRYRIVADPVPRYRITVEEDLAPAVLIDGVRSREEVGPRAVLDLAVNAVDDYGLARLDLLYQVVDGQGKARFDAHRPLHGFAGILGRTETVQAVPVDLGGDVLAEYAVPGNLIELVAEAADANDVTGPGVGRSVVVQIPVITEEELLTKLDHLLQDTRDRIHQARTQLGEGLRRPEDLRKAGRNAQVAARRSQDTLESVRRRWRQNRLKDSTQEVLDAAGTKMDTEAMPRLAEAAFEEGDRGLAAAQAAERGLGEVEELLNGILHSDDLERELKDLRLKQQALTEQARRHALDAVTGAAGAEAEQQRLQAEQDALAKALKEWERKLAADRSSSPAFEQARETVRRERPSDRLDRAADLLGRDDGKQQAVEQMDAAGRTMAKLLDQLQGGRRNEALARRARELAEQEQGLGDRAEDGERPQDLEAEQRALEEQVRKLAEELDGEDAEQARAEETMAAARQAMQAAAAAMAAGSRQQAASEANAAAGLLRQAARELEGSDRSDREEEQKQPQSTDILALLRELKRAQGEILRTATELHGTMAAKRREAGRDPEDPELDFFEQRRIKDLAQAQSAILLRLQEEGIRELEQQALAKRALERVATAVERAATHLATPALGELGLKRVKLAYYHICRLLAIAENLPELEKEDGGGPGQSGAGNQAPFPPRAIIALLLEEQRLIGRRTAASRHRPGDVSAAQRELLAAMGELARYLRPGSRPELLLKRAFRAGLSAAFELEQGRRGSVCRNEMDAALMALQRLLEEGKQSGGQSQNPQQQPQGQEDQAQSPPQAGQGQGQSSGGNPGGNERPGEGGATAVAETAQENSALMQLRPELRERLLEPATLRLPPGAYRHYQSYLELLESRE